MIKRLWDYVLWKWWAFTEVDRPTKNKRRSIAEDWNYDLEDALLRTLDSGRAVMVPLWMLHSSSAKGRVWKQGYKLKHQVESRNTVVVWLEQP